MSLTAAEQERWPEYAKRIKASDDPGVTMVGEFIEWMITGSRSVEFARWVEDEYGYGKLVSTSPHIEKLLSEWLGINHEAAMRQQNEAIEEELARIRKVQANGT